MKKTEVAGLAKLQPFLRDFQREFFSPCFEKKKKKNLDNTRKSGKSWILIRRSSLRRGIEPYDRVKEQAASIRVR